MGELCIICKGKYNPSDEDCLYCEQGGGAVNTTLKNGSDLRTMNADVDFMTWLKDAEPGYDLEYTGHLLERWDAFNAGRELERRK